MGENPPDGAIVDYALARPARHVVLSFYDRSGRLVRRYASDDAAPAPDSASRQARVLGAPVRDALNGSGNASFRLGSARAATIGDKPRSADLGGPARHAARSEGPLVLPGVYIVRLDVDGHTLQRPLSVVMDPRVVISNEALATQYLLAARLTSLANKSYAAAAKARNNAVAMAAFTKINGDAMACWIPWMGPTHRRRSKPRPR